MIIGAQLMQKKKMRGEGDQEEEEIETNKQGC